MQLESDSFIRLDDVLLKPFSKYNYVSQNLITKDIPLCLKGDESALKIERRNGKYMLINFTKKFGQERVILTKNPSFESLVKHAMDPKKNELSSHAERSTLDTLSQEPKLHKSANPWIQSFRIIQSMNAVDTLKKARSLLNKITPSNKEKIIEKFCRLEGITLEKLRALAEILFQKAISEPVYCNEYAMLVEKMIEPVFQNEFNKTVRLSTLMFEKIQFFFDGQRILEVSDVIIELRKEIVQCIDEEKKRQLLDELDDAILFRKKKFLGCIQLIGALYLNDSLKCEIIDLVSLSNS